MTTNNIRTQIKNAHLFQYEVADKIGINEVTLIRWLRKPLPKEKEAQILSAIEALKKEREHIGE